MRTPGDATSVLVQCGAEALMTAPTTPGDAMSVRCQCTRDYDSPDAPVAFVVARGSSVKNLLGFELWDSHLMSRIRV